MLSAFPSGCQSPITSWPKRPPPCNDPRSGLSLSTRSNSSPLAASRTSSVPGSPDMTATFVPSGETSISLIPSCSRSRTSVSPFEAHAADLALAPDDEARACRLHRREAFSKSAVHTGAHVPVLEGRPVLLRADVVGHDLVQYSTCCSSVSSSTPTRSEKTSSGPVTVTAGGVGTGVGVGVGEGVAVAVGATVAAGVAVAVAAGVSGSGVAAGAGVAVASGDAVGEGVVRSPLAREAGAPRLRRTRASAGRAAPAVWLPRVRARAPRGGAIADGSCARQEQPPPICYAAAYDCRTLRRCGEFRRAGDQPASWA